MRLYFMVAYRVNDIDIYLFYSARTRKSWHGKAGPVPYNLRLAKGESHVILNREFVDFTLHSKVSHQLLDYLKSTYIPCEWFYQTLNANPQLNIPGTRKGKTTIHSSCYLPKILYF